MAPSSPSTPPTRPRTSASSSPRASPSLGTCCGSTAPCWAPPMHHSPGSRRPAATSSPSASPAAPTRSTASPSRSAAARPERAPAERAPGRPVGAGRSVHRAELIWLGCPERLFLPPDCRSSDASRAVAAGALVFHHPHELFGVDVVEVAVDRRVPRGSRRCPHPVDIVPQGGRVVGDAQALTLVEPADVRTLLEPVRLDDAVRGERGGPTV